MDDEIERHHLERRKRTELRGGPLFTLNACASRQCSLAAIAMRLIAHIVSEMTKIHA